MYTYGKMLPPPSVGILRLTELGPSSAGGVVTSSNASYYGRPLCSVIYGAKSETTALIDIWSLFLNLSINAPTT